MTLKKLKLPISLLSYGMQHLNLTSNLRTVQKIFKKTKSRKILPSTDVNLFLNFALIGNEIYKILE